MAEPDSTESVTDTEHDNTEANEVDDAQTTDKPAAPVKASPLQRSFLERRKTRDSSRSSTRNVTGSSSASKSSASKSSVTVRRSAADDPKLARLALRAVALLAVVGLLVTALLFGIGRHRIDQRNEWRAEYTSFAQQVLVNLTTLSPKNADQLQKTLLEQTSGKAQQQMQQASDQTIQLIKQGNISTSTTILSSAVTAAEADEGSVIVVYGWTMRPSDPKAEVVSETYRWKVDMRRINDQLKMTNFEWVT